MVARPIAVLPCRTGPTHAKCARHLCRRGLNNRTSLSVAPLTLATFGPLFALHRGHAKQRFERIVLPPCCSAMIWSTGKRNL
jgi:hypothetical protein